MSEFLLTGDAFHALIRLVNGNAVAGLPSHNLTHQPALEAFARGNNELSERGLRNDTRILTLAQVIAYPDRAIIVTRDRKALPRQEWMFYAKAGSVVEQTFPGAAIHRLATVTGGEQEVVTRLVESLGLTDVSRTSGQMLISQSLFQEVIRGVRAEARRGQAQDLLFSAGVPASLVENFLEALDHAVFAAVIVFLKISGDEAIDARELTVLQGIRSLWVIHQEPIGGARIKLALADKGKVLSIVESLWAALS